MSGLPADIKFKIILNDGSAIESHDQDWKPVADHANALAPNNDKPWREYQLITRDGFFVAVGFETGVFNINGQFIHPASESSGTVLTNRGEVDEQKWDAKGGWSLLNSLRYFPVVGRRVFKGFTVDAVLPYCGWKHQIEDRTYEKVAFLYPNNQVVLQ